MANIKDLTGADAFTDQMRVPVWDQSAGEPRAVTGSQIVAAVRSVDLVTQLTAWAESEAFLIATASRDANGLITTASIKWPDGVTGTFTTDAVNSTWTAIDAFHATYNAAGTKTVTLVVGSRDRFGGPLNVTATIS